MDLSTTTHELTTVNTLPDIVYLETYLKRHKYYGTVTLIKGDSAISDHIKRDAIWEEFMLKYFEKNYVPNTDVIDIGAYIGLHTIALSKIVSNKCTVHAFEPQKQVFDILEKNSNKKIKNYHLGVSDKSKTRKYVTNLNNGNPGGKTLIHNDENGESVDLVNLDLLKFERRISLIKIDCEGDEINVLKGGINLIKKDKPIIICEIAGGMNRDHPITLNSLNRMKEILKEINYEMEKISFHDYLLTPC